MILGDYIRPIDTNNNSVYIFHETDFYICLLIVTLFKFFKPAVRSIEQDLARETKVGSHMNIYET